MWNPTKGNAYLRTPTLCSETFRIGHVGPQPSQVSCGSLKSKGVFTPAPLSLVKSNFGSFYPLVRFILVNTNSCADQNNHTETFDRRWSRSNPKWSWLWANSSSTIAPCWVARSPTEICPSLEHKTFSLYLLPCSRLRPIWPMSWVNILTWFVVKLQSKRSKFTNSSTDSDQGRQTIVEEEEENFNKHFMAACLGHN